MVLEEAIKSLENNEAINIATLELVFAPTSSIQEISMSNGWSNEYLSLSEKFDTIIRNF